MNINWLELLINIILASFGGIVKKLVEKEKNPDVKISPGYYSASAFISLFAGIIVYFLCKEAKFSIYLIMAVTALAGFGGTQAIHMIYNAGKKKFKLEDGEDKKQ